VKILVAGATGVIGRRLVPRLVEAGHEVVGMSRFPGRAADLAGYGARGIVGNVFNRDHLHMLIASERPEVVIHELTDLPQNLDPRKAEEQFALTNRLRSEGTRNLVDAAQAAGARRVVAQSYAHVYSPHGDWVKTEDDPINEGEATPEPRHSAARAIVDLEHTVLYTPGIEGVVLRYGAPYGPDTAYAADGQIASVVRRRAYPVVGDGRGMTSFLHVDDAVDATLLALKGSTDAYNICDDEPAPLREWLPVYAQALGAPSPRHVPVVLARLTGGEFFVYLCTEQRGASNEKARRELGFVPRYASWRQGFGELSERMAA
jgi:nucleoside-diphosphate-sugar epimerase